MIAVNVGLLFGRLFQHDVMMLYLYLDKSDDVIQYSQQLYVTNISSEQSVGWSNLFPLVKNFTTSALSMPAYGCRPRLNISQHVIP